MPYSQKPLIKLFKEGKISGKNKPPKHIETVISNVFVFDKIVYKFYKNNNDFFNKGFRDISVKLTRFDFTRRDFDWNHTLSPSIYLKLNGVRVIDSQVRFSEPTNEADELIIVMNRVDTGDILFDKLMRNEITKDECFAMGKQLAKTLNRVRKEKITGHNYHKIFENRIKDLRAWIGSVSEHISEEESSEYADFLDAFRNKHQELFENQLSNELAYGGDSHSHNAVFTNGSLYLMDTFPPKEEWLIEHHLMPLYRIGTDIWVLSDNKELFDAFLAGYEEGSGIKINHGLDVFFVIYASAIMVSYLYMLQRTDMEKKKAAQRFHRFIKKYYKSVA